MNKNIWGESLHCPPQLSLTIERFNHLSFENHFLTSEMLAGKAGDADLANTGAGGALFSANHSTKPGHFIDDLLEQDGCLHKPEKERKQQTWQKETEEKMWQMLKQVGNRFKKPDIHGEYWTTGAHRWADGAIPHCRFRGSSVSSDTRSHP